MSLREASCREVYNSTGSYSANVGLAIENGGWQDEGQLQDQLLTRKGFAFINADKSVGMMEYQVDLSKSEVVFNSSCPTPPRALSRSFILPVSELVLSALIVFGLMVVESKGNGDGGEGGDGDGDGGGDRNA